MADAAVWFERCEPHEVSDLHDIFRVTVHGYLHLPPGFRMMVQSAEAADALEIALAPPLGWESVAALQEAYEQAVAERDEACTFAVTCACPTSYEVYDGPQADCPVHGAVRSFNKAQAHLDRALKVVQAAQAWAAKLVELGYYEPGEAAEHSPFRSDRFPQEVHLVAAVDAYNTSTEEAAHG